VSYRTVGLVDRCRQFMGMPRPSTAISARPLNDGAVGVGSMLWSRIRGTRNGPQPLRMSDAIAERAPHAVKGPSTSVQTTRMRNEIACWACVSHLGLEESAG